MKNKWYNSKGGHIGAGIVLVASLFSINTKPPYEIGDFPGIWSADLYSIIYGLVMVGIGFLVGYTIQKLFFKKKFSFGTRRGRR